MAKAKFDDPYVLKQNIDAYFESLGEWNPEDPTCKPPTMSGLAYWLGVTRKTLTNYIKENNKGGKSKNAQCCELLVSAKARIEAWMEEQLVTRAKTTGLQFALKNNYDWDEQVNVSVDGKTEHSGAVGVVDATKLTDEELIAKIELLTAKVAEIQKREGK